MNGIFTISLDFELHWGGFEKWPLKDYENYFLNTRSVIPRMLDIFSAHDVHVTWATVGILLHNSREELLENLPANPPSYAIAELSAFHYIKSIGIGENEKNDPFHFAPTLVRQIIATAGQELGSHTFSHYYCNEEGQTLEQFRSDIQSAQRVARKYNLSLRSLVFPRNQFNEDYLRACFDEGITVVRSNPLDWFWNIDSTQHESAWKRLNRGLDAYFEIGKKNTFPLSSLKVARGLPLSLPASRLLRPYNPKEFFLNDLKIRRVINEMTIAAKNKEIYHLWWHPHNFGWYPEESMRALNIIMRHFRRCSDEHGMKSLNMGEIDDLVVKPK
jgi:peptidoglycan/xylan/chitin deacetylase (PgdA/CDA1 family)